METTLQDIIRLYFPQHPMVGGLICFIVFLCVSYIRTQWREISGWIGRVETDTQEQIDELRAQTREGLKEERAFRHDVITTLDNRIHDISKELGEVRGLVERKKR
jgi:hypothetical protein